MENITLSEALRRIKALKGDIARWSKILPESNTWEEDRAPTYSLPEVLQKLDEAVAELIVLKTALASANASCSLQEASGESLSLTGAVTRLSELKSRMALLEALPTYSSHSALTGSRVEHSGASGYLTVRFALNCSMTTRERDDQLQKLRDEFAALNARLEAANNSFRLSGPRF